MPVNDLSRAIKAQRLDLDRAMAAVLDSGWVVLGPQVRAFEEELGLYLGVDHVTSVANGTDALTIALTALGCRPGDLVATVANAGGYSSTAIRAVGAVPIYVEVDPTTALVTPTSVAHAIDAGAKVVVVTHLFGAMAPVEEIVELCRTRGVRVLEDCAQSIGAQRGAQRAGTFGDVAAFSFYPTKNLGALGDGGAVVTNSADLDASVRSLRQYGWTSKYTVGRAGGCNSRLDELQAAVLRIRLPRLDEGNARRREIHARYTEATTAHFFGSADTSFVGHLAVFDAPDRDRARARLDEAGIGTDIHYPIPDHRQPFEAEYRVADSLAVSEQLAGRILTVPCFPELLDAEVDRVCDALSSL